MDTLDIKKEDKIIQLKKEPKYFCGCGTGYITRSGLSKHKKKCVDKKSNKEQKDLMDIFNAGKTTPEEKKIEEQKQEQSKQEPSVREQAYLQQELVALYINNPSIHLDKPVNLDYINLIKNMSGEELKMRIMEIKQNLSTKIDRRYSDCGIRAMSFLVGTVLGIEKELQEVNSKDQLLGTSAQEVLTFRLGLFALPAEVKTSGIFLLNTVDTKINKMRINREKNNKKKKEQDLKKKDNIVKVLGKQPIKTEVAEHLKNEEFGCFA